MVQGPIFAGTFPKIGLNVEILAKIVNFGDIECWCEKIFSYMKILKIVAIPSDKCL